MDKIASMGLSRRTTYCCLACIAACVVLSFPPSAVAERLYSSGFELNSVTNGVEFAVPAPTGLSINSSTVRSGSYSLRQNSLFAEYIEHQWLAASADAHVFIRFYFRVAALPSTTARVLDLVNTSGSTRASLRLTSTGTLQLFNETAQVGPDSWALVKDLWHCVEMEFQSLNAAGYDVLQARLDGTPFAASLKETLGTVARFRLGNTVTLTGSTPDFYFDDVAINDQNGVGENEFPGPGKIVAQSPNVKSKLRIRSAPAWVEYAPPSMVSAIADDHSGQGRGIQTGDRVVVTFDTGTNGYSITSSNVDAVLRLSNSHSWLGGGGQFGGASWGSAKYPNDTLVITLSNTSGTAPSVAVADYITIGANTIKCATGGEDLTGSSVRITGTFTGPWYYHVNSAAAPGNTGTAYQNYSTPFPAPSVCWHNISDALNAVKTDARDGPWVVQVDDTATYDDAIQISDFPTNASATLTIRKNPALSGRPTVYPTAAGKRAFNIGRGDQPDGENSYVTIQGFVMSNNASGDNSLCIINQSNLTMGQIVIEDCVFDGLGQTYVRNPQAVYECHVDTVFRNNEVKNFTAKKKDADAGPEANAGFLVVDPRKWSIAGGKKVQVIGNSFHDNTGILSEFVGNRTHNWKYSLVYERNRIYSNTVPAGHVLINIEGLDLCNTVINNLFHDNAIPTGWGTLLVYGSGNTRIFHNTFFNNHTGREIVVTTGSTEGVEIKNNLFWPTPGGRCIDVERGCTANLVSANNAFFADFTNDGYPPGFGFSMTENTETVGKWNGEDMTTEAWNKASKNNTGNGYTLEGPGLDKTMHLVAGSLCIDRGVPGLLSDDMDGKNRPVGAGYDIGADEYGAAGTARPLAGEHEPHLDGQQLAPASPICLAVYTGDILKIEAYIQEGFDINKLDGHGHAPLHYAAQNNQKQAMELIIAKGGDINVKNSRGQTPLFNAIAAGNRDVAELLISKGADVNVKNNNGQSPLDSALSQNRKDIFELLIAKGAEVSVNAKDKDGKTPLHVAADNKRKYVAELLLSRGADVNANDGKGYTPLYYAIWEEDQDIVRLLVTKGADVSCTPKDDYPPLHYAVWNEDVNAVKLLVDHGAKFDVKDQDGWTAFRYAASQGNRALVEFFASKGTDVSTLPLAACVGDLGRVKALVEQGADPNAKDELGWTPLSWAASTGQEEVAAYLIEKGADVNVKDRQGNTPLHSAAAAGRRDVAELLIAKGADVKARTTNDRTPLHRAVLAGHKEMVELLIANGADANFQDKQGHTALNLADLRGHTEIAEILRKDSRRNK